jgi:glucose-6-phosphate 1-epimerase
VFDKSKPISGGAPLCFPRFGPSDEMQQHGFARNSDWTVISSSADPNPDDPEPSVMFKLRDSEYTREMWDHAFEATYEVTLRRESLRLEFSVRNPLAEERKGRHEDAPFDFTAAIHTYVEVADATSPNVFARGLIGKNYIDKAIDPNVVHPEMCAGDVVFGTSLCDKVFLKTEPETDLHVGTGAAVCVENTRGWTDTVVWNPHETLNIGDAWKKFVCVESAAVSDAIVLDSGKVWTAETNVWVVDVD